MQRSSTRVRTILHAFICALAAIAAALVFAPGAQAQRGGPSAPPGNAQGAPRGGPPPGGQRPAGIPGGPVGGPRGGNAPSGGPPNGRPGQALGRGATFPPGARMPNVHVPLSQGRVAPGPPPGGPFFNFRGRDFSRFNPQERALWQAGAWRHERHDGFFGWWWVAGGLWYFYPGPIYPYPGYVSDYLIPPPPISPQYQYYCDDPPGYYPFVRACYDSWQVVPLAPPPPDTLGPLASADVRQGYRIAQTICSSCHIIQPGQATPPFLVQRGPSFQAIANRPNTTADSLRTFIATTGWDMQARPMTMPNQSLSEQSIDEVVAYIMSLRQ